MQKMQQLWDDLCSYIIRPTRCDYDVSQLGPQLFRVGDGIYERTDTTIINPRGLKLQCSHFEPTPSQRPSPKMPCVVYLHGNCGSRLDALECATVLLPHGITLFAFDFSGSGLSEGEYVSLGYYEKQDVVAVVDHLNAKGTVSRIGLWGRSMGAVTSIMYSAKDSSIGGIVADSPFCSLHELMQEIVIGYRSWIPRIAVRMAIRQVRQSILDRAQFDIGSLDALKASGECEVPAILAHAKDDQLVNAVHSRRIREKYKGECTLMDFEGDHNSERPEFFLDAVTNFFLHHLVTRTSPPRRPSASASSSEAKDSQVHVDPMAGGPDSSSEKGDDEDVPEVVVSEPLRKLRSSLSHHEPDEDRAHKTVHLEADEPHNTIKRVPTPQPSKEDHHVLLAVDDSPRNHIVRQPTPICSPISDSSPTESPVNPLNDIDPNPDAESAVQGLVSISSTFPRRPDDCLSPSSMIPEANTPHTDLDSQMDSSPLLPETEQLPHTGMSVEHTFRNTGAEQPVKHSSGGAMPADEVEKAKKAGAEVSAAIAEALEEPSQGSAQLGKEDEGQGDELQGNASFASTGEAGDDAADQETAGGRGGKRRRRKNKGRGGQG